MREEKGRGGNWREEEGRRGRKYEDGMEGG